MNKVLLLIAVVLLLTGCITSHLDYAPPLRGVATSNFKVINKSRDAVWNVAVPKLGKLFFVINNLDKTSGLINISYTGDPMQYVDCGVIKVTTPRAVGDNTQTIPAAIASKTYYFTQPSGVTEYQRKLELDGRVNLIFEQVGENQTQVTVNSRYVLNRQVSGAILAGSYAGSQSDSISFNSGGSGQFASANGISTVCLPTGKLEQDILSAME